jgi:hypothetical protein
VGSTKQKIPGQEKINAIIKTARQGTTQISLDEEGSRYAKKALQENLKA